MKRRDALVSLAGALGAVPLNQLVAAPHRSARWITLGTSGGPQVQPQRAQIANALIVNDALYLFDLGNDVQRQLARVGIAESKLRAAFISHHHLDHNADLGPVMMNHWLFGKGRLPVYGPLGTTELVSGIAVANAPTALASFPTAGPAKPPIAETVLAHDIPATPEPVEVYRDSNIAVTAIAVDHFQVPPSIPLASIPQALAFRVEVEGRSFVYSGDTGPSRGLELIARNADYLIVEVVELEGIANRISATMPNAPPQARDSVIAGMKVNHLVPETIGRIAAAANVGCVVLTHFVPVPEQMANKRKVLADVRKHFAGKVILARDLDTFA